MSRQVADTAEQGPRWTARRVAEVAPDRATLVAAQGLVGPGPWSGCGASETLLWGRFQGTGTAPYQVSVDLTGPVFRCTCPSRKQPCKHALALLLRWVDEGRRDVSTPGQEPPEQGETGGRFPRPRRTPDPVAQARRREQRLALMTGGMEDFARWLEDLVRAGTAAARQRGYGWWDAAAARLVDAQLPGLAEQVRTVGAELPGRADWDGQLLESLGRWWAATRAWERLDRLDEDEVADLRAFVGWPYATAEIRERDALEDSWLVLGAHRSDDGRLQRQRTWLWGEGSRETVLVLDFAVVGAPLPTPQAVGSVLATTVARYPGTPPRRALLGDTVRLVRRASALPPGGTVADGLAGAARVWAGSPWPNRVPLVLDDVAFSDGTLVGLDGLALPVSRDSDSWESLALTGGAPVAVFGELEPGQFRPLAIQAEGELVGL